MTKMTIAEALKEQMLADKADIAWAGEPDVLLKAYEKVGGTIVHPLNRIQAVIGAARKSKLFAQDGYIRACDSSGRKEVLLPRIQTERLEKISCQEKQT